jgi:cytochrome P450
LNYRVAELKAVKSVKGISGPRSLLPAGVFWRIRRRGFLPFLEETVQKYGDVAHWRITGQDYVVVSHPEDIREILVTHAERFTKGPAMRNAKVTLGEGLLTSEGELHRRQRRLVQPAFHPKRVEGYGEVMVRFAEKMAEQWRDGEVVDVAGQMTQLTLQIAAKVLFDAEIETEVAEIGEAMGVTVTMFDRARLPWAPLLNRLPLKSNRRFRAALGRLEELLQRMILERKRNGAERGDFLSLLLGARDDETGDGAMNDKQVRDEAITLFSAGHETTANALVWTWYLLAKHPEVEAKLHRELDEVLQNSAPTAEALPRLKYARQVLAESMRLYPPAWVVGRQCIDDYEVRGFKLRAGTVVLMSQWVVHRDARWWDRPTEFDPERWSETGKERPKYAYFPFGGGPRACIGEPFAWMEGVLLLASIARGWKLRLVSDEPIKLHPTITLRPRDELPMRWERRRPAATK